MRRIPGLFAITLGLAGVSGCQGPDEEEGPISLSAPVEILVDEMGVSHIYAQTDSDALYAAGYRVASERLYEMEMLKRLLAGRLAEVLGEELLEQDQQLRIFDVPRWGAADAVYMQEQDPEMAGLIAAWLAGVNRRIAEVRDGAVERPFGFRADEHDFLPELWTDEDPYIVLKGVELGLGRTVEFEIAVTLLSRMFPEPLGAVELFRPAHSVYGLPPQDRPESDTDRRSAPVEAVETPHTPLSAAQRKEMAEVGRAFVERSPQFGNSNNWAIDGRFTESGRPLIAGDPHLDFQFMGAVYPMHINSADAGGGLDVAGFAYPGIPGIALGHTRGVLWTQTTAFGDVMDVWEVEEVGGGCLALACDVRDPKACEAVVAESAAAFGGLDALVYSPGITLYNPIQAMDAEAWRSTLNGQ